ncbi:hypothetical protein SAMN02745945_01786 [Peptoclostridium litorale DSM 5388]|uniref:Uncharacterized protein n=1 Tax=Peptoclostridium litorale DSM 5388 TaxID=1121324 RepID=A0A069RFZ2_PEPLI|nr:hypothetical protein [Peptoclostridium litorale]KDR95941.1 hypothetical protein CLIT_8c01100 [Peptoclostridium litorale DSM 5388]SIO09544.1 hypothetical protein SAMN02745945_01786 [Peptoclostridium litorale DSM 5388]
MSNCPYFEKFLVQKGFASKKYVYVCNSSNAKQAELFNKKPIIFNAVSDCGNYSHILNYCDNIHKPDTHKTCPYFVSQTKSIIKTQNTKKCPHSIRVGNDQAANYGCNLTGNTVHLEHVISLNEFAQRFKQCANGGHGCKILCEK